MSRNVSQTFKEAVFAQQTSEVFIMLLTIDHESFVQPIRVASDPMELLPDSGQRGVLSRGEEYIYLPFSINLPAQDDTGIARAQISIDNVSRDIIAAARQAKSPISITMEIVLSSDVDTPEITVADFKMERITYDAQTISGDISVEYYDLEPMPSGRFNPAKFPGIF